MEYLSSIQFSGWCLSVQQTAVVAVTVVFSQCPCSLCYGPGRAKITRGKWKEWRNMRRENKQALTLRKGLQEWLRRWERYHWSPHCRIRFLSGNQSKKEIQDASPPAGGWTLQLLLFLPTSCLLFHSSSLLPMQRAAYAHIMLLYPHHFLLCHPLLKTNTCAPPPPTKPCPGPYCLPLVSPLHVDTQSLN